jgi:hypothetical protein
MKTNVAVGCTEDHDINGMIQPESCDTTKPASTSSGWTRLNHKGIYHDNRRLVQHRVKNCQCHVCYREIHKLPPATTREEYVSLRRSKKDLRDIQRTKKLAKKEVKSGKQSTIVKFFRY